MRILTVRNVSEAWAALPHMLTFAVPEESRAGPVLVMPEPVATVYQCPSERVLMDAKRDCNPFFHVVETLWMLAGRNDVGSLTHYVRNFGDYAEKDGTVHGAYGHRWRQHITTDINTGDRPRRPVDQLSIIIEKLRNNPRDRQAVLQMWDAAEGNDLDGDWKDRPCNTHAYFRVRSAVTGKVHDPYMADPIVYTKPVLDLTVCCRSNDMVFGGYGANAVQFSVLLEYMAARIGVGVGTYTQISNNYHVYRDVWDRVRGSDTHVWGSTACAPMFEAPGEIDEDLRRFFQWHDAVWEPGEGLVPQHAYTNPWFEEVAQRVTRSYYFFKRKNMHGAIGEAGLIKCPAWHAACMEWLYRRQKS